jgi:energy-converting hydrogenase Eha subunit A
VPNPLENPEFIVTLAVMLAGAALVGAMAWAERRPRTSFNPSLIPTTPVMLVGLLITVFALVHLLNLFGIRTGR